MERALLVTVDLGESRAWSAEDRSRELAELAKSAGAKVVREEIARRHEPQPAYFIGSGKAKELAEICMMERIGLVIFNNDLSGTQQKNLEEMVGTKTIDRTQLILDIFARHARSNEGKVQVELAQLLYLLPRLTGKGIMLSRLGGGIGTRGPGEQKLEVDRRRIRDRIARLKGELNDLSLRRQMMRTKRGRFSMLTIALVGYTNAGKSTLLNALTESDVIVGDKLFATLDPTIRQFVMPNKQKVLFIDTVGFLNDLPHHLIEAFKATLEEVAEADLIIHIVDASHPKAREQAEAVNKVLSEIGAIDRPRLTVLNKIDKLVDPALTEKLTRDFDTKMAISALNKTNFDLLINNIMPHINGLIEKVNFVIPQSDTKRLALIYENGLVLKREYRGNDILIEAEIPIRLKEMLTKFACLPY